MNITTAEYSASYKSLRSCPTDMKPEFAFIGRSNVGKSSLLNMLCNQKKLAKTSGQPGKTQSINYFIINKNWYMVDLPGYGYAKISKSQREQWRKMIETYLLFRENLQCAFLLIDLNVPPQAIDLEFMDWMGKMNVPFVIAFTKTDKMKEYKIEENLAAFEAKVLENWEAMPQYFITASEIKRGRDEILDFIEPLNERFYNQL